MPVTPSSLSFASGVTVALRSRQDGRFAGWGAVTCGGTPLRDPDITHACEVRTPDGWQLGGWQAITVRDRQDGCDLVLRPTRRRGVPMEWMVHAVRSRVPLPGDIEDGDPCADGELTLELRSAERTVGDQRLRGFSYRWPDATIRTGMEAIGRAARQHGIQVQMWGNTALSSLTHMLSLRSGRAKRIDFWEAAGGGILPVLRRARDPWVHNPTGGFENDHYNPVFMLLNLADPDIRAYWHERWRAAHDEVGIAGLFLDSAFNLSSDTFSFRSNAAGTGGGVTIDNVGALGRSRPAVEPPSSIHSLYLPYLTLMAEMQRYGVRFCGEDLGVFGTHRTGPAVTAKLDNLFMWNEVYAYWDGAAVAGAGHDPADVFFQGLAYRQPWELQWNPHDDTIWLHQDHERPDAAQIALFGAFNRVNDRMRNRTILPDGSGALYRPSAGEWVLWAFADGTLPRQPGQQVIDVLSGAELPPGDSMARRNRVYHGRAQPCGG